MVQPSWGNIRSQAHLKKTRGDLYLCEYQKLPSKIVERSGVSPARSSNIPKGSQPETELESGAAPGKKVSVRKGERGGTC